MTHGAGTSHATDTHEHEHPGERLYVKVAIVLSIITIIEVAIYYFNLPHSVLVTALIAFSAVKFYIVVSFFMHLKFDDKRLAYIFIGGLVVGGAILLTLDVLEHAKPIDYAQRMIVAEEGQHASE